MDADPAGTSIIFTLVLLLFFTLMNAYFAGAEMAVVSVNKTRIHTLAADGNKKAKLIEGLFEDSTKFLSTIQVAITFAGFYSSASAAAGLAPYVAEWLQNFEIPYSSGIARNGLTLILMFFNLVFGELVPKRIALQKAEAFSMLTVMPIHYISIVLSPFIKLLSVSTKVVLKALHMKTEDQEEAVTEEEIKALLKMGNETGTFDDEEREMIDSVFAFDDRTARELMVPRRDVFTLDIEEPFEEMIDEILEALLLHKGGLLLQGQAILGVGQQAVFPLHQHLLVGRGVLHALRLHKGEQHQAAHPVIDRAEHRAHQQHPGRYPHAQILLQLLHLHAPLVHLVAQAPDHL